jgi:uncharacterized RDD family membrane protein YckC
MANKFCEKCGCLVMQTMRMCPECGAKSFSDVPKTSIKNPSPSSVSLTNSQGNTYAGFWERFAAASIDTCIGGLANIVIGFVVGLMLTTGGVNVAGTRAQAFCYLLGIVVMACYYSLMESSNKRATFGKECLGLVVTDYNYNKISLGQGVGRYFGRWISALLLGIGYYIQPFTERKQTLHDMMAGTLVIRGGNGKSGSTVFLYALLSFIVMCLLYAVIATMNRSTY